jgi:uncharacterized protein
MIKLYFRFYEELNDFLPEEKKKIRFEYEVLDSPSVKDAIEALGVPHTEVDMILVKGKSVSFDYNVKAEDDISVYPVFESFEIKEVQHLRPQPLRNPRFIIDVHLGSLAKYMRMAGFDVTYRNNFKKKEIIEISLNEKRTILTKDRNILKRSEVTHGCWIRSIAVEEQFMEVFARFHLDQVIKPFTRCLECNGLLVQIEKEEVINEIPPKVKSRQEEFKKCSNCAKIYWKGTHYEKMHGFIDKLRKSL